MGFMDWDGDGDKDFNDSVMDYIVYKNVMKDNKNNSGNNNDSCGSIIFAILVVIIVSVMAFACGG